MRSRIAFLTMVLASLLSVTSSAQRMVQPKDQEPGDRAVFNFTVNNRALVLEQNWIALTADDMVGIQKFGDREYAIVLSRSPPYRMRKGVCLAAEQACTFSPALDFVDFPLETGKKWKTDFTATGETFTAEVMQDRVVERIESIRVPAGEFETYKIVTAGRIKSRNSKGAVFTGKEDDTTWVALISGKMITVKVAYRNSFGEHFTLELLTTSFK